ncbi:MAG: dethiobiotin synthase [Cellvibrionaceae bacterium]
MSRCFFIAGTDTEVGKTFVSVTLLHAAKKQQLTTSALKPIAAGCEKTSKGTFNEDALALQQAISTQLDYERINPVALESAIAPHIAAAQEGRKVSAAQLLEACQPVLHGEQQFTLVEGAGGWRVPLNDEETLADFVKDLNIPVILVVGMRLGCINHALLTVEAIANDGLPLAGWVANQIDANMPVIDENLATLTARINAPCLGHIPFLHNAEPIDAVKYVDIGKLLV